MHRAIPIIMLCLVACTSKKAAEPPKEAPAPTVPAEPTIKGEEVTYKAGDTTLKGYIAWDENQQEPRPGVIVVHQWWGISDYARMRARMLAEIGYTALALDMYGGGKHTEHPEDAQKFMQESLRDMDVTKARFGAAYDLLKRHEATDASKIAVIGYCYGGAVALHAARFGFDLDGVVSFHGTLGTEIPAKKGTVKAKILVLHGADDPFVPPAQVAAFKEEMHEAGVEYDFVAYPGAKHAFTDPAATARGEKFEMPLVYDEQADRKSWAELERFLAAVFQDG